MFQQALQWNRVRGVDKTLRWNCTLVLSTISKDWWNDQRKATHNQVEQSLKMCQCLDWSFQLKVRHLDLQAELASDRKRLSIASENLSFSKSEKVDVLLANLLLTKTFRLRLDTSVSWYNGHYWDKLTYAAQDTILLTLSSAGKTSLCFL